MKNIHSVLVVGSGNIGRRHIQALSSSQLISEICIVEPSSKATKESISLIKKTLTNKNININYFQSMDEINPNKNFLLAVISTNSYERLKILRRLIKFNILNFLLEKILFPCSTDLLLAKNFLSKADKAVFVNYCYRFKFPFEEIKLNCIEEKFKMSVILGNTGLITNIPHWIDIFSLLASENIISFKLNKNCKIFESKRGKPYYDIFGSGYCKTRSGNEFVIKTKKDNELPIIKIESGNSKILIKERNKVDMKSDEVLYFSSPLVSLTTKYFLNDLINKKQILPKFSEIFENEKVFLNGVKLFTEKVNNNQEMLIT